MDGPAGVDGPAESKDPTIDLGDQCLPATQQLTQPSRSHAGTRWWRIGFRVVPVENRVDGRDVAVGRPPDERFQPTRRGHARCGPRP